MIEKRKQTSQKRYFIYIVLLLVLLLTALLCSILVIDLPMWLKICLSPIVLFLGIICESIFDEFYYRYRHIKELYEFIWKSKTNLTLADMLGSTRATAGKEEYRDLYYERLEDSNLHRYLLETTKNILIIGMPLSGKSRMVFEGLKKSDIPYVITKLNPDTDAQNYYIPHYMGNKEKIFILDDLDLHIRNKNFHRFLKKMVEFDNIKLIATCKSGNVLTDIKNYFLKNYLDLDNFFPNQIEIKKLSKTKGKSIAEELGITWDPISFDGNIGSLIIVFSELSRRINADCNRNDKKFLEILKYAYLANLAFYDMKFLIEWLVLIANCEFDLELRKNEWNDILEHLQEMEIIQLEKINNKYKWLKIEEAYLKKIIKPKIITIEELERLYMCFEREKIGEALSLIQRILKLELYKEQYNELLDIFLNSVRYDELMRNREEYLIELKEKFESTNNIKMLEIGSRIDNLKNIMPVAYIDLSSFERIFSSKTGRDFLGTFDIGFDGQDYLVSDEKITDLIYGGKENKGRPVYILKDLIFKDKIPKINAGKTNYRNVIDTTEVLFFKTFKENYAESFIQTMKNNKINPYFCGKGRASGIAVNTVVIFAVKRNICNGDYKEVYNDYYVILNKRSLDVRTYPEFYHIFPSSHFSPDLDDDFEKQFDCYINFEREYLEEFFNVYSYNISIDSMQQNYQKRLEEIKPSESVDHFYTSICYDIINFHLAVCTVLIIHDTNWILNHATQQLEEKLNIKVLEDADRFSLNFETLEHTVIQITEKGNILDKEQVMVELKNLKELYSLGQLMPPDGFGALYFGLEKFKSVMKERKNERLGK